MKLPVFIKVTLNIVFYIVYVLFITILVSFTLPLVFKIFIENGSNISSIIQFVIAVVVLFITTVYRKYFYISIESSLSVSPKGRKEATELGNKKEEIEKLTESQDDELNILVAKEK